MWFALQVPSVWVMQLSVSVKPYGKCKARISWPIACHGIQTVGTGSACQLITKVVCVRHCPHPSSSQAGWLTGWLPRSLPGWD